MKMKPKEAIRIMENEMPSCGDKLTFTSEECYEAYQMAIEALNKQIPKKPLTKNSYIECPYCHTDIESDKGKRQCVVCGQAIDWSEAE